MLTTNNTINTPKNPSKYIKKLNIIQLNTSNSDWDTKKHKLITTITNLDADITIVSESNAEISNNEKMETRKNMFSNYSLEDKVIHNQNKARMTIIVKKEIPYKRCPELQSNNNSTIVIKVNESKSKNSWHWVSKSQEPYMYHAQDAKPHLESHSFLQSIIMTYKTLTSTSNS